MNPLCFIWHNPRIEKAAAAVLVAAFLMQLPCERLLADRRGSVAVQSARLYVEMDSGGRVAANLLEGTQVSVISELLEQGGESWYRVETEAGLSGYLPAAAVSFPEETPSEADPQDESEAQTDELREPETGEEADGAAPEAAAPEAGEAEGAEEAPLESFGRFRLQILDNTNMRESASTTSSVLSKIPGGTEVESFEELNNEIGETWYGVEYNGDRGYVRSSTVTVLGVMEDYPGAGEDPLEEQGVEPEASETSENTPVLVNPPEPYPVQSLGTSVTRQTSVSGASAGNSGNTDADPLASEQEEGVKRRFPLDFFVIIMICLIGFCGFGAFFCAKKLGAFDGQRLAKKRRKAQRKR